MLKTAPFVPDTVSFLNPAMSSDGTVTMLIASNLLTTTGEGYA